MSVLKVKDGDGIWTSIPSIETFVDDGSLTYKKLEVGTLGYVTPEMFGAKGDGVTDDTQAVQNAINSGFPFVYLEKSYLVSALVIDSIDELHIYGGTIFAESSATVKYLITATDSENITFDSVTIESTNDQEPSPASGHSVRNGSLSSNVGAFDIYRCSNCTFNNVTFKNLLYGLIFNHNIDDSYNSVYNSDILVKDCLCIETHEFMHSKESNNVVVDNIQFIAETPSPGGYHPFYLERNTGLYYISNVNAVMPSASDAFFDFADYNTLDDTLFKQETYISNCNITAPTILAGRYRNKICAVSDCNFKLIKFIAENGTENTSRFIVGIVDSNTTKYPKYKFNNCILSADDGLLPYLSNGDGYAEYDFASCDCDFDISQICKAVFNGCISRKGLVRTYTDVALDILIANTVFMCNSNSNFYQTYRGTSGKVKYDNCLINYDSSYFVNNSAAATKTIFNNCKFVNGTSSSSIQADAGTGVVLEGLTEINGEIYGEAFDIASDHTIVSQNCVRVGNVVSINALITAASNISAWGTLATIPSGYRPKVARRYSFVKGADIKVCAITTGGIIQTAEAITSGTSQINICLTYNI